LNKQIISIDAFRGFAATWVVFYHLWNRFYPDLSTQHYAFSFQWPVTWDFITTFFLFQYGYLGVTLFFVLSGFCIHLPQARRFRKNGKDQLILKNFAQKRFWRLYPAYFASIVFTIFALVFFPAILSLTSDANVDVLAVMDLRGALYNALFLQQFSPDTLQFNNVYWTLLFEVQFYAFYPILLLLMRRTNLTFVFLLLLFFEISSFYIKYPVEHLFLTRYYEWYLGVLAAEWYVSGKYPIPLLKTAIWGIFGGLLVTFIPALWPFRDVLIATGFLGAVLYFINLESNSESFRNSMFLKIFAPIGIISYSLYLLHVPIIDLTWSTFRLAEKYGFISLDLSKTLSLIAIPISFYVAYVFYIAFEKRYLKM
jgi:peptidoglycan/LPS O-acetylase OafA/YrhL